MEKENPDKRKSWSLNSNNSNFPIHDEKKQENESLKPGGMSPNIPQLNEEPKSAHADLSLKISPMEIEKQKNEIFNGNNEPKRSNIKQRKVKTALSNKKCKKNDIKLRSSKKPLNKMQTKHAIIDEEDSLHATMDLGGTTIPAEPSKYETAPH